MQSRSIKTAAALLKANGVSLFRNASGEFQIRLCNSARNAPYYFTDDLDDAVTTGLTMASEAARLQELTEIDAANGVSFVFSNR